MGHHCTFVIIFLLRQFTLHIHKGSFPAFHMTHHIFLHITVSSSAAMEETTNQPWKVPRTGSQSDAAASSSTASRPAPLPLGYPAPVHREANRRRGISKIQVRAGRTRDNQLTPEEEHQQCAAGIEPHIKAPPGPINLDKDAMHTLMDWVWKTFTNKHQAEDKNGFLQGIFLA